jgi:hypothetical protein
VRAHGTPPASAKVRTVSVRGDKIVKIQEAGASRRERLRTLAGHEVGSRTGLFVVPEIVSFDDSRGEIIFERLSLTGIREALSDSKKSMGLAGRVAAALAAIHQLMEPIEGAVKIPPDCPGGEPRRNSVPLHGDFGIRNVFHLTDSDRIAIIDWSNSDWMGIDADLGAPEIDVAVFLMSLFRRRPFGRWPISRLHDVARHFLTTYSSASPHGLDIETLRRIVRANTTAFNQENRRRKGWFRALGYSHNMPDLAFFLRRFSGSRFATEAAPRED